MPKTKTISRTATAPDLPPEGTQVILTVRDGVWVAAVTVPVEEFGLPQTVRPADLANDAQRTRVTNALENVYDAAMRGAGFA
ncbi:MAG: hypothetical protein JNK05_34990 [Myxococcales bacterium]|nr:hypothetical protein [Myxococcales bacterium]